MDVQLYNLQLHNHESIVGSVVECSPATRAARVRFPDDAIPFFPTAICSRDVKVSYLRRENIST